MSDNCMIGFPNNIDSATLSGGSFAAGLPITNLFTRALREVARTTNTSKVNTWIGIDQQKQKPLSLIGVVNHNLSTAAKFRIRGSNESSTTNLIKNSGTGTGWALQGAGPATVTNGAYYLGLRCARIDFGPDTPANYAGSHVDSANQFPVSNDGTYYAFGSSISLSRPLVGNEAVTIYCTGAWGMAGLGISSANSGDYVGKFTRSEPPAANYVGSNTGNNYFVVFLSGTLLSPLSVYIGRLQAEVTSQGGKVSSYWPTDPTFVSRAGQGTYFDSTGSFQTAAANVARMTYDPANLANPPYLMVEPGVTKCLNFPGDLTRWVQYADAGGSVSTQLMNDPKMGAFVRVTKTAGAPNVRVGINASAAGMTGPAYVASAYIRRGSAYVTGTAIYVDAAKTGGGLITTAVGFGPGTPGYSDWTRFVAYSPAGGTLAGGANVYVFLDSLVGDYIDVCLPDVELGTQLTSPLPYTTVGPVVRAGDVVSYNQIRPAGYMDDTQSYGYDSGWRDVWPIAYPYGTKQWEDANWWGGKYSQEEIAGYTATLTHVLPFNMLHRWWRIDFDDVANPDGFLQFGRVFIGPSWQPADNMSWGESLSWETKTEVMESLGGQETFDIKTPYRVERFKLSSMSRDEAMTNAFEIQRRAGVDKEVFWIQSPGDTVHAIRTRFLGRLRALSAIEYPYYDVNTTAFEIKELQ